MKRWIERALNIHPGDLGRGTLLCSCLFLVITTYKIGGVAGPALFLSRFQAKQLAYADISSAALVILVVAAYVWVARRVPFQTLMLSSTLFFASNCALFWGLIHYLHLAWLFPVFYVWVKIFGVLVPTQIWTLANYVLTTREAKRVFGMVGGGGIAGWIFSGFFSKTIAKRFGAESLLLGMVLFLLICTGLIVLIWRSGWVVGRGGSEEASRESAQGGPKNLFGSMKVVFSSSYLRAIAAVICIGSLVTTLTGWQFLAIAQQTLQKKDALAAFFGDFNFYAGILSLAFQLLVTPRFLRRFGIGAALFALPATVLLGSAGVLAFGTLGSVVVLKGFDQVQRYSLDKSAVELLYLPLSARIKIQVKWFIDTVVWRLGDGLSGLAVLIFATTLHMQARQISGIVMLLIAGWLVAVTVAKRQYVATLKESISQHRVDAEQTSMAVLDRSTAELLATNLSASDPKDILYALSLFEVEQQRAAHPAIPALLSHSSPEVRRKAIAILSTSRDPTVRPAMEQLLRDPDLNVRTEALLYLTHCAEVDPLPLIEEVGDFSDFSVRSGVVAFLARPGEAQNLDAARQMLAIMVSENGDEAQQTKLEAARLLGELPDCFDPSLSMLLADPDVTVVREAIRSVGKLRKRRLVPELLDRLGDRELCPDAAQALGEFGDMIVGALRDHLGDYSVPIESRREVPSVLVRVGTPAAANVLMENLLESDTTLRFRTISALNKLCRRHPEIEVDVLTLETVLAAEILGHYRSYQILDKLGDVGSSGQESIARPLTESMKQELERIFRLLGLLYPHFDVHSAYVCLQSSSAAVHDNALEFLDSVLKVQLREMLVPLLDGKITVAARASLANRLVRSKIENREHAVAELVNSEDPWLRSCGAHAIGTFGLKSLEDALDRCLNDSDPLLRETARAAKQRLEIQVTKA